MQAELPGGDVVLESDRLRLRSWTVADAPFQRRLWLERDPRVPRHRRIGSDGRPTVTDLEESIRRRDQPGLLAVERTSDGELIGYCGLILTDRGQDGEPELAFEFERRAWGRGYATEAALVVVAWAAELGCRRLWATVREWNGASRRVLSKVGFLETDRVEPDRVHGDTLFLSREL